MFNRIFVRFQELASDLGCHQLLWLFGEDRQITEVGAMNVFILYKNQNGGNYYETVIYGIK